MAPSEFRRRKGYRELRSIRDLEKQARLRNSLRFVIGGNPATKQMERGGEQRRTERCEKSRRGACGAF